MLSMSADNFWYVTGNKVICGFESDYFDWMRRHGGTLLRPLWLNRLLWGRGSLGLLAKGYRWHLRRTHHADRPLYYAYVGKDYADALKWARDNYAEYGVWW